MIEFIKLDEGIQPYCTFCRDRYRPGRHCSTMFEFTLWAKVHEPPEDGICKQVAQSWEQQRIESEIEEALNYRKAS